MSRPFLKWGLCFIGFVSEALALSLPFKVADLQAKITSAPLCADVNVSQVCRAFPSTPRPNEGVLFIENTIVVLGRQLGVGETELDKLSASAVEHQKLEISSLLFLSERKFLEALSRTGGATVVLVMVSKDEKPRILSALVVAKSELDSFAPVGQQWRKDFADAGTWAMPADFNRFYEFQTF